MMASSLAWSAVLLWLMIVVAGLLKYEVWSWRGIQIMVSNREQVPPPTRIAARADRAARNMIENLVLFVALAAAIQFASKSGPQADLGAWVFLLGRIAYWPTYLTGIVYLRTGLWLVATAGLAIMASSMLVLAPQSVAETRLKSPLEARKFKTLAGESVRRFCGTVKSVGRSDEPRLTT
jgi:uncharacterized MAPEG superfamily protein